VFILTRICAVKKFEKKKNFCRPTDPNFLAYVTGNIELFFTPKRFGAKVAEGNITFFSVHRSIAGFTPSRQYG
jgi:hypothetical protein